MIAKEIMMESLPVLDPADTIAIALQNAMEIGTDVLPIVDRNGQFHGILRKTTLAEHAHETAKPVLELCCDDAIVCSPDFAIENIIHDSSSTSVHQSIVVVDDNGRFHGLIPSIHWAIDEARVQSGHPRAPLEVRTSNMHLIWRCLDCGELIARNDGLPEQCPHCHADVTNFTLHTED